MKPRPKILVSSLVFSPDGVSTAYLYNDIALALSNSGYDVSVLSTTPHFNVVPEQLAAQPLHWGVWGLYKISSFHGIKVYHVPQKKFRSTALRLAGFFYWHLVSFILALCIRNVDLIISPSPPLTIGLLNKWLGKLKRCKVVYNVQEIYPDILGLKPGLVRNVLSRIEKKVYDGSDAVTTIDTVFRDTIAPRFRDVSKLHIIPNFVDTQLYRPAAGTSHLDKTLFPDTDRLKVLYAGNIGFAQDWQTLVRLAEKCRGIKVDFTVIGEGVMKTWLEEQKAALSLDNLRVLEYQPREIMPEILAYSDLQFIFMTPEMGAQGFPSKVYTIMACGKPLMVASAENTPIVNFLAPVGCAEIFTSADVEEKTDGMAGWLSSVTPEQLSLMGEKGGSVIAGSYTKEKVTQQYIQLINNLLK